MFNRTTFYACARVKLFSNLMHQEQVEGITKILNEWERRGLTDLRWLAYMLATVFHETAERMQPIRELGSEEYLRAKPYYPWVGMGLVQVTWQVNAAKFGAAKPEDLLTWPVALRALFDGMTKGMFTGKKLSDYFGPGVSDAFSARRIINGTDKASLIAGYYADFLEALQVAAKVPEVVTEPAAPTPATAAKPAVVTATVTYQQPAAPTTQPETWGDFLARLFFKRNA